MKNFDENLSKKIEFLTTLEEKYLTIEETELIIEYASEGIALAKIMYAKQTIEYLNNNFDYETSIIYLQDVENLNLKIFYKDIGFLYIQTNSKFLKRHGHELLEKYINVYQKQIPIKLERYLKKRKIYFNN